MNSYLRNLVGALVAAVAIASVACGKSGGNNNNNTGAGCIYMNGTCVAASPGYVSNGQWTGNLYSTQTGSTAITVRLTSNGGYLNQVGGYGVPNYGGGFGAINQVQTTVQVSLRLPNGMTVSGQGIAVGSTMAFTSQIQTQSGVLNLAGQFVDNTQRALNVQASGLTFGSGQLAGQPNNTGGYGGGGWGNGGGWGQGGGWGGYPGYDYGYGGYYY